MVFYFVRKIKGNYYLYKVEYDPYTGKRQKLLGNCMVIEEILKNATDKQKSMGVRARRLAWLGRRPHTAEVRGSSPRGPTNNDYQQFLVNNF